MGCKSVVGVTLLVLGVGLGLGCKNKETEETGEPLFPNRDTSTESSASTKTSNAGAGATSETVSGAKDQAAAGDALSQIPDVPTDRSKPPQAKEWGASREINTAPPSERATGCSMHVVREWLKVHCDGKVLGYDELEGLGGRGADYFDEVTLGQAADFVLRMRSGVSSRLRFQRQEGNATMVVSWPAGAAKPVSVALSSHDPATPAYASCKNDVQGIWRADTNTGNNGWNVMTLFVRHTPGSGSDVQGNIIADVWHGTAADRTPPSCVGNKPLHYRAHMDAHGTYAAPTLDFQGSNVSIEKVFCGRSSGYNADHLKGAVDLATGQFNGTNNDGHAAVNESTLFHRVGCID